MIFAGGGTKVYVATKPVDFRKGMDSLSVLVEQSLGLDPHSGAIYVFRSKRSDRLKVLVWDGTGLVMGYKRLEDGRFAWPSIRDGVMHLSPAQFEALVEGLDFRRVWARQSKPPLAAG